MLDHVVEPQLHLDLDKPAGPGWSLRTTGELENLLLPSVNQNNGIIHPHTGVKLKEAKPGPVRHRVYWRSTEIEG